MSSPPATPKRFPAIRRLLWALPALLLLALLTAWGLLRASLPQRDGRIELPGLQAPLAIGRDALGTVVLQGEHRLDLARGLGFVHAQERFFEMDLTRRSAAGELAALFGAKALERDRARRPHRLRARLAERLAALSEAERALLQAYTAGVNAGLAAQRVRPWQYLLMRAEPQPWAPVDSLLVISEMFAMLQSGGIEAGFERALLRERSGDALFDWLNPRGGRWDAALDGSVLVPAALPGPELLDLRRAVHRPAGLAHTPAAQSEGEAELVGSNNWAVAGRRTGHGGALLADDMHLGLTAPGIWFRAQLQIGRGEQGLRAAGLSLPGVPSLVVGANGRVAWGFTNAYGQWFDWIAVPEAAADGDRSLGGRLRSRSESLEVKGEAPRALQVLEFDGHPVLRTEQGKRYALRWIAHQGEAYNLQLDRFMQAGSVDELLGLARQAGMPQQNMLMADRQGHIAWTVAGRLWAASADPTSRYGRFQAGGPEPVWLPQAQHPQLLDPADGQLWTANNRQAGGALGALIGDGGFDLGARGQQIRDRLSERKQHDEASFAALQLDREARLLKTWARRIEARLAGESGSSAERAAQSRLLQQWNGRADADQAAYRLIRTVRLRTLDALWAAWTAPFLPEESQAANTAAAAPTSATGGEKSVRMKWRAMFEYSASQALEQQPAHLLPPGYSSWAAFELAQIDAAVAELSEHGKRPLEQALWGQANASRIQHVLSRAIPALAFWLDMPAQPQGGDAHLPQVAQPAFGQSQRLVVAPGREEKGLLSVAGGQSGHPLSPYYGAGHADWAAERPTPLLAGEIRHELRAQP